MHIFKPVAAFAKRFSADKQGGVLIMFAAGLVFLVAIGGAAVDLGLQQLQRIKLQNSVDAAATSAASLVGCAQDITEQDRRNAAQRYFDLNYPRNFVEKTARPTPEITVTGGKPGKVEVKANDDVQTHFVNNFLVPRLASRVSSAALISDLYRDTDFDVVMLIDETGSTRWEVKETHVNAPPGQSRMDAEKRALGTFIQKLFPDCIPNPNLRMGLVGYNGFISNKWALTSNRADAQAMPGNLSSIGMNIEELGFRAARNMLTHKTGGMNEITLYPESRPAQLIGVPPGTGQSERRDGPRDSNTENLTVDYDTRVPLPATNRDSTDNDVNGMSKLKYIVLITDGSVETDSTKGWKNGSPDTSPMLEQCEAARAEGIIIHAINFVSTNANDRATLRACVDNKDENYHEAPSEDAIAGILNQIAGGITKTRIVQ